jgi:hypothetical protein
VTIRQYTDPDGQPTTEITDFDGDIIEVVDHHDYNPSVAISASDTGGQVYVVLQPDEVDALIVALAETQDHSAATLANLMTRERD